MAQAPEKMRQATDALNSLSDVDNDDETLQKAGVLIALITGKGDKSCRITLEQFGMG